MLVCRYDAEGLRHEAEENGRLIKFIYSGRDAVCEKDEENGFTRYIRGNGRLVASDSENARTYYHYACDSLGSVDYVLAGNEYEYDGDCSDVSGRVLCRYEYDAFGNVFDAAGDIVNRYGFAGEMRDDVTGMYYLRARYYSPGIGRFTQADAFHGDGLNLYVYAGNNPVRYVDPSGHCCKDCGVVERQLLNGEEWYQYFKEEYGADNVQGSIYNWSQAELQKAMDDIYLAALNSIINPKTGKAFGGGPRQTITITQDGRVFLSQNSNTVNPQSKIVAQQIFGNNVKFIKGGDRYKRPNMTDNLGNHSEMKGLYHLEKNNIPTDGAKQFSSHYSCDSCRDSQRSAGILNYTGYASDHGNIQKRIDY